MALEEMIGWGMRPDHPKGMKRKRNFAKPASAKTRNGPAPKGKLRGVSNGAHDRKISKERALFYTAVAKALQASIAAVADGNAPAERIHAALMKIEAEGGPSNLIDVVVLDVLIALDRDTDAAIFNALATIRECEELALKTMIPQVSGEVPTRPPSK